MKHEYSFSDMSHGRKADDHQPKIEGGKGKEGAKTSGHINPFVLTDDAKGHGAGFNAGEQHKP